MKKILLGLASVGAVAGVTLLVTGAFFSDTETSTGNTFQAGAVDLKIDSECHYFQDGNDVGCFYGDRIPFGKWDSKDLTEEKFFMFDDVKPGDYGENTLSLTVIDNDAYACMYIENAKNEENTIIDPEIEAGDITADVGELAENLHFTAWLDQGLKPGFGDDEVSEGDNIWQGPTAEPLLFSNESGPASDVLDGKVYDLNAYGGLLGGVTHYVGIYWCAGDLKIVGDAITCDGSTMGNESQTDSLSADVRFYVEQKRNNANFVCPALPLPQADVVESTTWSIVDTDELGGGKGWEWLAKAKVQESPNPASDFELQVGVSDSNSALFSQNDTIWSDNVQESFTLTYDGSNLAKLEVAGRPTTTYAVGSGTFGRIGINLKAPADGTTYVSNLALNVASLPITSKSVTGGTNSLTISGVDLSSGFVLTGNFTFDWGVLTSNGENQKIQFSID